MLSFRQLILSFTFCLTCFTMKAQVFDTFKVEGDIDKYYPVTFNDYNWNNNKASELLIGRSNVHADGIWKGSLIARFRYHSVLWGNGAGFIEADMYQNFFDYKPFIAGWREASAANASANIMIWLRGGTTYYIDHNPSRAYVVYDGVANPLPFQEVGGPAHSYKTGLDAYVNFNGISNPGSAYFYGGSNNFFGGKVGIGTYDPGTYMLAVEGTIGARKVKVTQGSWADFVFKPGYKLPTLIEVEAHIAAYEHLPGIPSEKEVLQDGVDLGEMNKKLLQKVEEQTLYIINMNKKLELLEERLKKIENNNP